MKVRRKIEQILRKREKGEISYQEATDKILLLFDVSGSYAQGWYDAKWGLNEEEMEVKQEKIIDNYNSEGIKMKEYIKNHTALK